MTVAQAAEVLGISEGAVRSRIKRGTLSATREGGRLYVVLGELEQQGGGEPSADQTANRGVPKRSYDQAELVEALRDQIEDLRGRLDRSEEANRENRRIIAGLIERVPELEAPDSTRGEQNPPDSGQSSTGEGSSTPESSRGNIRRRVRWWRRWIGG